MKKRFISLCLTLALTAATAGAAFSDISSGSLQQTASVLGSLGIMQGTGNNRFEPNRPLTRAEFCKLAVTAMGIDDASPYANYTIFPDVRASHWAARYVNAALRHPDFKDNYIIRGYADGTFGPDRQLTYGEVCTMLLRMLGYKESDIGPFWPADYIAQANALGLTRGISIKDAKTPVTRADAATMLLNTLGTATRSDGQGGSPLISRVSSSTVENCILLETSETDSSLATDEALFYENGTLSARKTAGRLDRSLIGVYGTLVIGKKGENVAVGVVPNTASRQETYEVVNAAADRIVTKTGTFRPNRDTPTYISRDSSAEDSKLKSLTEVWSSILPGDTLHAYYNEYGSLALLAVLPGTSISHANTFVYGIATSANIPSEYKIVKNGAVIDPSGLKKYDVVTLDAANRQALVSDTRVSGRYSEGGPTVSYPQEVKVYGNSFRISDSAAAFFKDMKLKDYITLLFDADGNVAAAYPRSTVSADMQGIVTAIDEGKATVTLTNGITLRNMDIDKLDKPTALMGRLVSVSTNGDKAVLTRRTLSGKTSGEWSLSDGKLGSKPVSSRVNVYEEVLSGAPLSRIALSDISLAKVPSSDIRYTVTDSAGTITTVILGDVTGDSWLYGMGSSKRNERIFTPPFSVGGRSWGELSDAEQKEYEKNHPSYDYFVTINYWNTDKHEKEEATFRVLNLPSGLTGGPIAVPKGYSTDESIVNTSLDIKKLKLIDTVDRTAFDGASGVRTKDGYYALADQLGIYDTENREFIATLQSAKSNYTKFALYANDTAEDGGKIRIITVSNK
ncbi:S-layer homology domain-containing protein [Agathobaculum sp.]|uniref:S-layer homology domain-containing protein n=1 Tax=Agathobaculum sp. TaxID=2048138 RepID=UPI00307BAC4F